MTLWIFQANPDRFDIDAYLAKTMDISWLVSKEFHAGRMSPGDRVFLWRAKGRGRTDSGIIASGHITDTPSLRSDDPAALEFWVDPAEAKESLRVGLHVDRVADAGGVLTRKSLLADPVLRDLPHFKMAQGTNWELSTEQAARLEELWGSGPTAAESADRLFGPVDGVPSGAEYANRRELSDARIHRPLQAGICGSGEEGAESIVLSGGYEDDVDYGDVILYTGQGGNDPNSKRQVAAQELTRGNKALAVNKELGIPVRVVRGPDPKSAFAPKAGYRYDGLYLVEDYWHDQGKQGLLIWRYRLRRMPDQTPVAPEQASSPDQAAARRPVSSQALIRDSAIVRQVKRLHDHQCQMCGTRVDLRVGPYAEAAHIRPLGVPHNGPDKLENLLCLCPNCHKRFDGGGVMIAEDFTLVGMEGRLRTVPGHTIGEKHLAYHRAHYDQRTK